MRTYAKVALGIALMTALVLLVLFGIDALRGATRNEESTTTFPSESPGITRQKASVEERLVVSHRRRLLDERASTEAMTVNATTNAGLTRTVDLRAIDTPAEVIALQRHRAVKQYLQSPARDGQKFQAVAAICQEYGMGPWAVVGGYDIAWEARVTDEFVQNSVSRGHPAESLERLTQLRRHIQEEQIQRYQERLGIQFPDDMIQQLAGIRPTEFIGQQPLAEDREEMLDQIVWDDSRLAAKE